MEKCLILKKFFISITNVSVLALNSLKIKINKSTLNTMR